MTPVVSAGNHPFAVEYHGKYKKPYHWQLQMLHIFLSLETKQQAEVPTHRSKSKVSNLKTTELMHFCPSVVSGNGFLSAIFVLQLCSCLAMELIWAPHPNPSLCPHSQQGAKCHWTVAESACLGNAVEWAESLEPGFLLLMRLIFNTCYSLIYKTPSVKFLAKACNWEACWRLCSSPLATDHGLILWAPFSSLLNQPQIPRAILDTSLMLYVLQLDA